MELSGIDQTQSNSATILDKVRVRLNKCLDSSLLVAESMRFCHALSEPNLGSGPRVLRKATA